MEENFEHEETTKNRNRSVHMANERTFLAWVRTSIGIMAFGFVVEKFGLFIKQMAYFLNRSQLSDNIPVTSTISPTAQSYSSIFGISLVTLGALLCLLAFLKYKKVEKEIEKGTYYPSNLLDVMLTLSVLSIGIVLGFYLV